MFVFALALGLAVATPAAASEGGYDHAATEHSGVDRDGAEPIEFVALAIGGTALVSAIAALIMGTKRPPA